MVQRLLQPTLRDQVALFHKRERRKSHLDPTFELFKTHDHDVSGSIDTATRYPSRSRNRPYTISTRVKRDGAIPNGIVVEMGDATTGLAVWLQGTDILAAVGGTGDNGVTLTGANALLNDGQERQVTVAAVPGYGVAGLFVDSRLLSFQRANAGNFPSGWSSSAAGAVGAPNGAVSDLVPGGSKVALADAQIIRRVSAFVGQIPTQLRARFVDSSGQTIPLIPLRPDQTTGSFNESFNESFD
jgi:hypothetical protein